MKDEKGNAQNLMKKNFHWEIKQPKKNESWS